MDRRRLLQSLGSLPAFVGLARSAHATDPTRVTRGVEALQRDWRQLLADGARVAAPGEELRRSDAEWKKILTPAQFEILRKEGTERPGSSPLNAEKRPGVYVCVACDLPLFTSSMKFDSGTGWPSFFTLVPGAFGTRTDYKLVLPRTEYHCARCGGHHGHVFDDGPLPTGQRWCNNGVALRFIPKAGA
jgi:peptide-methionine (R)-S-oxide reductase